MAANEWPTKRISVASLHLDSKNPRLGRETLGRAPRELLLHLFDHDKAMAVAESIAKHGFFPSESLLAVKEDGKLVVVEGNRRLAALKALREPALLEGSKHRQIDRLSRLISDPASIAKVPVTIAPTRRATDQLIAVRHIGTPVLPWEAENRASFILEKLSEGYDNNALLSELGFTLGDIQAARQTRAIADMARSLDLPDEVKAKLDNPRAKIFTTIERVIDSTVGREFLKVSPDSEHGIRGQTSASEFIKGFTKLVTEVSLGKASSRTLNSNDDIRKYFEGWGASELPAKKQAEFVPSQIIKGPSVASAKLPVPIPPPPRPSKQFSKVLPRDLRVQFGSVRLKDIRRELVRLDRVEFPNAGAVLLRVFLELAILDYLERTGELAKLVAILETKGKLRFGIPTMKELVPTIVQIAKSKLSAQNALKVEKALHHDPAAPFSLSDLHSFVHTSDPPSERDIWQFWIRTEPLFRLMLDQDPGELEQ